MQIIIRGWLISKNQKTSVGQDVEKLEPLCTVGGNINGIATVENNMEVPQKVKNRITTWPAILGIFPKELKAGSWRDTCTPMFIAALFTIAKRCKQPKCPSTDEWVNKMWYIHIMEYYLTIKRNEILIHTTTWMSIENIRLSERSRHKRLHIV